MSYFVFGKLTYRLTPIGLSDSTKTRKTVSSINRYFFQKLYVACSSTVSFPAYTEVSCLLQPIAKESAMIDLFMFCECMEQKDSYLNS